MRDEIPPKHPVLILLDPEGLHVRWKTIEELAAFRRYKWKAELLILFPSQGLERAAGTVLYAGWPTERLDAFWGNDPRARELAERRRRGEIKSPGQARAESLDLYEAKLSELGYATVYSRAIKSHGTQGGVKYYLVFATDNATGARIMDDCFKPEQQHFDGILPPDRP